MVAAETDGENIDDHLLPLNLVDDAVFSNLEFPVPFQRSCQWAAILVRSGSEFFLDGSDQALLLWPVNMLEILVPDQGVITQEIGHLRPMRRFIWSWVK